MNLQTIISEKANITQGIKDEAEFAYLNKALDIISDELDLEAQNITVSFDPPVDLDKTQYGLTIGIGEKPNNIFIAIDKGLSTGDKLMTMAHEMVHAQQLARGDLIIHEIVDGKIKVTWQGEDLDIVRYSKSNPWEVEAYTRDKALRQIVIDEIGNFIT